MKQNKIIMTESQLKQFINETVSQILEYNDEWLKKVGDCGFLSDEDKKAIQIASVNNWDRHEREEKKKQDMDKLEKLSNKNIHDKRMCYQIRRIHCRKQRPLRQMVQTE